MVNTARGLRAGFALLIALYFLPMAVSAQEKRPRALGIHIGVLKPGPLNAITDVPDLKIGHETVVSGQDIRTGVTAIIPHSGNLFQEKVPAAIYIGNGFGKLAGYSQVKELGNLETPIVLTNTLSVPAASEALIRYTLAQAGNENLRSVNPVVGETNDGYLNDIRGMHVSVDHVQQAMKNAKSGPVAEGNVGAGTGTICFGFKGGIGTASRVLPEQSGAFVLGVLVQTNFGGVLSVDGVPIGEELGVIPENLKYTADGSCMMVVATNAPLDARNLERLAKRCMLGLARTGGIASNGSGDYVIAFSTATANRIAATSDALENSSSQLRNEAMTPLFQAAIEATEEAIINSLFAAESTTGFQGHKIEALPKTEVLKIMKNYNRLRD